MTEIARQEKIPADRPPTRRRNTFRATGPDAFPPYIYGMHEPGGERLMEQSGTPGWILYPRVLGLGNNHLAGPDYRRWADRGFGVLARIDHDYGEGGTIPLPDQYEEFARRVGESIAKSQGCRVWILGNEMNRRQSWPKGEPITPAQYAACYKACRDQIQRLPDHQEDQLVVGAVGPWANDTAYPGNKTGDWVRYFADLLQEIEKRGCPVDGIALHTYTHGADPELVFSEQRLDPPFQDRYYHFRAYRDFMEAIPAHLRDVPVYITETDQDTHWEDANRGWVQNAYREIDGWNSTPGSQQIRALILYRWPKIDRWSIEDKPGVHQDWLEAMKHGYTWGRGETQPQFWLVTANPAQYDWDRAFDAGSVEWTEARGNEAQKNIRTARPGDVVLAYRSTPDRYIAGLGQVSGEPYEYGPPDDRRHVVRIDMGTRFARGVSLDDLRQAVPDLQHVTRTRPVSFSPVTPAQWAQIRALILERNPDLSPESLPPAPDDSLLPRYSARLALLTEPRDLYWPGEAVTVEFEVQNLGTEPLSGSGEPGARFYFRVTELAGGEAIAERGKALPTEVLPGKSARVATLFAAPPQEGRAPTEGMVEMETRQALVAPVDTLRIEWSLVRDDLSPTPIDLPPHPSWTFRNYSLYEAQEYLPTLHDPASMPTADRRREFERLGSRNEPGSNLFFEITLLDEGLLPGLLDPEPEVARAALGALYNAREWTDGIEDHVRDYLYDQAAELAPVKALLADDPKSEASRWLRGLMPAWGVEIVDTKRPEHVRAGDTFAARVRLRNAGDVAWPAGQSFAVTWRWWAPPNQPPAEPDQSWQWTHELAAPVDPGSEADVPVQVTASDQAAAYTTAWEVAGRGWDDEVSHAGYAEPLIVDSLSILSLPEAFDSFSPTAQEALRWAEAIMQAAGAPLLDTRALLAGLFQLPQHSVSSLLTMFDDESVVRERLEAWLGEGQERPIRLSEVSPISPEAPPRALSLASDAEVTLNEARRIARERSEPQVHVRHLLAGLLAVPQSDAALWIADWLAIDVQLLSQQIAASPDGVPSADEIRLNSRRGVPRWVDALWGENRAEAVQAVAVLYGWRTPTLEDHVREVFAQRPEALDRVHSLAREPRVDPPAREWVTSLLPSAPPPPPPLRYGIEIAAIAAPESARAGEALSPTIRLRNSGEAAWPTREAIEIGWRWWVAPREADASPNHDWSWSESLPNAVAPGEEIPFALPLTAPDVQNTFVTEWQVTIPRWADAVPPVRRGTSLAVRGYAIPSIPDGRGLLSGLVQDALGRADAIGQASGAAQIDGRMLLAGLAQCPDPSTRLLLGLFDGENAVQQRLEGWLNEGSQRPIHLQDIRPVEKTVQLDLAPEAQAAIDEAIRLARQQDKGAANAVHVLAGLLSQPDGAAGPWIVDLLRVDRAVLYEQTATATGTLPDLPKIRGMSRRSIPGLIDALVGSDLQAAQAAADMLYGWRDDALEANLRARFVREANGPSTVRALIAEPGIAADVRAWLASLLPEPEYALEVARAEWTAPTRAGAALTPTLYLLNRGRSTWRAGETLDVTLTWIAPEGVTLTLPTHTWEGVALTASTRRDGEAALVLDRIPAPEESGVYGTLWEVHGRTWEAAGEGRGEVTLDPPLPEYSAAVEPIDPLPAEAWPRQTLSIPLLVTNSGARAWEADSARVRVALDRAGDAVEPGEGDTAPETPPTRTVPSTYPLEALGAGGRTTVTVRQVMPDAPGPYLLSMQVERGGDVLAKPLEAPLKVLDIAGMPQSTLLDGAPEDLPDPIRARRIQAIGRRLQDTGITADERLDKARRTLRPALFDPSTTVASAALAALHVLSGEDGRIDGMVRQAARDREGDLDRLRRLVSASGVKEEERRWLNEFLPEPLPLPTVSSTVAPMVIPAAAVQFQPPPVEQTATISVAPDEITMTYGSQIFRSRNQIDDGALKEAASRPPRLYGELLFEGVFNPIRVGNADGSTLDGYIVARHNAGNKLRLEWRVADPRVPAYKWEYVRDPHAQDEKGNPAPPLAVYADAPFYRRYDNPEDDAAVPATPLHILVAICNPITLKTPRFEDGGSVPGYISSLDRLKVSEELKIIRPGLERLQREGIAKFEILESESGDPVTFETIMARLKEGVHVLHILAHGIRLGDDFYLVMEDENRRHELVKADRFQAPLFRQNLRLVVLAACQSAVPDQASQALPGLGQLLVRQGVQTVIAMQDLIDIEAARLFARRFYEDLAHTGRIDMAMAATRCDLYYDHPDEWEWGIPVLFMSTPKGELFQVDPEVAKRAAADRAPLQELKQELAPRRDLPGERATRAGVPAGSAAQAPPVADTTGLIGALRALLAPSETRPAQPMAREQDRAELDLLAHEVQLDAAELKAFVRRETHIELDDAVYQQVCATLNAGKHVVLTGAPGTGKTSLAHAICRYACQPKEQNRPYATDVTLATATADWTTFDTIGGYVPTEQGTLQFRPGILLKAVAEGRWLVIDEINRAEIDKAFGELFTVLSGQEVELPYTVQQTPVRILPAGEVQRGIGGTPVPLSWAKMAKTGYDYVIAPSWRIIGTMNVYDKSYLFNMSFAFMRRFAFVEVDLPSGYEGLLERWFSDHSLPIQDSPNDDPPGLAGLRQTLREMIQQENALMKRRALGPAIVKDMIGFIGERYAQEGRQADRLQRYLGEAFQLYVVPQLDGLDHEGILEIYAHVHTLFKALGSTDQQKDLRQRILSRIEQLYPHIRTEDWKAQLPQDPPEGEDDGQP